MTATLQPVPIEQWRRRFSGRAPRARPRQLAALGYLANGPTIDDLIEIENLLVVVLYDEIVGRDRCALRLVGYAGTRIPWGVSWGGPEQCRCFKDLALQPVEDARGLRLDLASGELLRLGLQLERDLDRHARYRLPVSRRLRLPRLWAAFRPADAASITGDGPELAELCRRSGQTAGQLLQQARRTYCGLTVYPLDWVSHRWQQAVAVLADLLPKNFPRRQVFRLRGLPGGLQGFHGASQWDLYGSRFRRPAARRATPAAPLAAAGTA